MPVPAAPSPPAGWARRLVGSYREGIRGLPSVAWPLVGGTFLFVAARMGFATFLGIHFVKDLHYDVAVVGLAFLVENLFRGLVGPFGGALSDRIGRGPVLMGSILATGLLLPVVLLVQTPGQLLAWSIALGAAQGPLYPVGGALLMDVVPPERRQATLAVNYTSLSLGYTLGVAPAGFLAGRGFGLLVAFSTALLVLVALLYGRAALRAPKPEPAAVRVPVLANAARAGRDRVFLAFAALAFVFPLGIGLVALAMPVYAADSGIGEGTIGLVLGSTGILLAVLSIPVNARTGPLGPFRLLSLAALLAAVAYVVFGLAPTAWGILAGLAVFTLGEVLFSAAVPTAIAAISPPGGRGAYQGAWALVFATLTGSALALSGLVQRATGGGWPVTWFVFAAVTLAAAGGLLAARGWLRAEAEARSSADPGRS